MKKLLILILTFVCSVAVAIEKPQPTIEELQSKIEEQQKTIQQLRYDIVGQIEENKRLEILCRKAGIETTRLREVPNPHKTGYVKYRNKPRSKKWFDRMYERFHLHIIYYNGRFYDLRGEFPEIPVLNNSVALPAGEIYLLPNGYEVMQVLGGGELLITKGDVILHITGCETNYVDDQAFPGTFVESVGIYKYISVLGATKTVQSVVPALMNAKEMDETLFRQALEEGFELYDYVKYKEVHRVVPTYKGKPISSTPAYIPPKTIKKLIK